MVWGLSWCSLSLSSSGGGQPLAAIPISGKCWINPSQAAQWVKNLPAIQKTGLVPEDPCSICGVGRSPGEGSGNPLQYSRLEHPMDRGAWRATVHGVAKSRTRPKRLSTHTHWINMCSPSAPPNLESSLFLESQHVSFYGARVSCAFIVQGPCPWCLSSSTAWHLFGGTGAGGPLLFSPLGSPPKTMAAGGAVRRVVSRLSSSEGKQGDLDPKWNWSPLGWGSQGGDPSVGETGFLRTALQ